MWPIGQSIIILNPFEYESNLRKVHRNNYWSLSKIVFQVVVTINEYQGTLFGVNRYLSKIIFQVVVTITEYQGTMFGVSPYMYNEL